MVEEIPQLSPLHKLEQKTKKLLKLFNFISPLKLYELIISIE